MELAILIPVLRRPQNVCPLLQSIEANTPMDMDYDVIFITSPGDVEEQQEINKHVATLLHMDRPFENRGDYARKINYTYTQVQADWYFLGADDLSFHAGWYEAARAVGKPVTGTNDLGNQRVIRGEHATHSLVSRTYVETYGTIDQRGRVLHEGYPHEYVDDEFVETAKRRRSWGFAKDSIVEHLHPNWGKAPVDDIYMQQAQRMIRGRQLYQQRRRLWK